MKLPNFKINLKNPKVRNATLIIVMGVAALVVWHQMVYVKKSSERKNLKADLEKKQAELNSILAMKNQLEKIRQDTARANRRLDSLKSIFPDQKEIPKLIMEITRIARAAGIETRKFSPLPDVEKEYYIENRYSMAVVGGYHQIANFFSFLANMPLLVNLSEVNLSANQSGTGSNASVATSSDDTPQTVMATFTMTTFSSKR